MEVIVPNVQVYRGVVLRLATHPVPILTDDVGKLIRDKRSKNKQKVYE